jgi:hypothetical protein
MAGWETFSVVTGGAAGAMIGLLFVAVSIRVDVIAASADFSSRAGQTLILFATILLVGVLLAIPDESRWELGLELLALALVIGVTLYLLERQARAHASKERISRILAAVGSNASTPLLLVAAGVLLLFDVKAGLYLLVPTVIVAMISGLVSAWLLLIHVGN